MGTLSSFGIDWLVRSNRLNTFVETGTGHGHNLITALQWPDLVDLRSIEIDVETAHRARVTFSNEKRVRIYTGPSSLQMPKICEELAPLERRVLWFLDAHFPGSGRVEPLPMLVDEAPAKLVPIRREMAVLQHQRDLSGDVVMIDDLCLFEPGDYEHDVPELRERLGLPSLTWVDQMLSKSHKVVRSYRDGGYLVAVPR